MSGRMILALLVGLMLFAGSACVMVETPDVRVGVVGSPDSGSDNSTEPVDPYERSLNRVLRQQDEVAKELGRRDWDELKDEATDWLEYIRQLSDKASQRPDAAQIRQYCDRLVVQAQELRRAARHQDAQACQKAIDACDPILQELTRTSMQARPAGPSASPPPSESPARVP